MALLMASVASSLGEMLGLTKFQHNVVFGWIFHEFLPTGSELLIV